MMIRTAVGVLAVVALTASSLSAGQRSEASPRIKAFCVDFNWWPGGPNGFAAPGVYSQADPKVHLKWYKDLGANTIQTFCVNCCGYAWYKDSKVAPVQPGLKHDFLNELTKLAHAENMKVMGYFCVGANTHWGRIHPDLSYGTPSHPHIPLTTQYLDYLCASIKDALIHTDIDGFMIDWVFNLSYKPGARSQWLACEQKMYQELMGKPFPGKDTIDVKQETEFHRRAVERCWMRIHEAAKSTRPDCIIWLSCHDLGHPQVAGSKMFREVDWLMNEHPDPAKLESVRKTAGPRTRIIQCLCGWGPKHDAAKVAWDPRYGDVGFYGFAWPDVKTTLPPTREQAGDNERLIGNARNIESLRKVFHSASPPHSEACQSLDAGLVGYWKLAADCKDYSGRNNHGLNRGVIFGAERPEDAGSRAGKFDGHSHIEVPHSDSLSLGTREFSIAMWIKCAPGTTGIRSSVGSMPAARHAAVTVGNLREMPWTARASR